MICREGGDRNKRGSTPLANYEEAKQKHRTLAPPKKRENFMGDQAQP